MSEVDALRIARSGYLNEVDWKIYFDSDCRGNLDNCPLVIRYAIQENNDKIFFGFVESNIDIDLEFKNSSIQKNPLFTSILFDRVEYVKNLVEHGAALEAENGLGQTPLLSTANYSHDILVYLIQAGAELHKVDRNGVSLCRIVKQKGLVEKHQESRKIYDELAKRGFHCEADQVN